MQSMNFPFYGRRKRRRNPREQAIVEWRRIDLREAETANTNATKSAGQLMPFIAKDLRLDRRQAETEVVKVWNHLLDPNVTAHAQPTGLHNGTLFVTVDSSVWLDEIVRYRRREILQRLQHSFGRELIKKISFRIG